MANPNSIVIIVLMRPKKGQFDQFPKRGRTLKDLRSLHLLDSSFNVLVPNWMALKSKPDRLICFNLCVCKSIVFLIVLMAPFIISDSLTFLLTKSNSQGLLSWHFFIMHSLLTFGIGKPLLKCVASIWALPVFFIFFLFLFFFIFFLR